MTHSGGPFPQRLVVIGTGLIGTSVALAMRALVEIILHEGRKHVVRRMLAATGHPVTRLVRTEVGPIRLGNLKPGASRDLSTREIGELYAAVGL